MFNFNHIKDIYFFRYNIVFTTLTYVIPMILMGFCYTKMGRHLWGTPIIGEATPQLLKNYESKKKVRIIITVSEVQEVLTDSFFMAMKLFFHLDILLLLSNAK